MPGLFYDINRIIFSHLCSPGHIFNSYKHASTIYFSSSQEVNTAMEWCSHSRALDVGFVRNSLPIE